MASPEQPELVPVQNIDFFGVSIETRDIIAALKYRTELKTVCQQVIESKVIAKAAEDRGLVVTSAEIQAEADRIRRELKLERASDTMTWLTGELLTPEEWETSIRDRLLRQKLQVTLFEQDVERVFAQNRLDFEQVVLYQIMVPYAQLAQEVFYQIEEAEIGFYEAAHLYNLDIKQRYQCGYLGAVHRWNLHPDLAAQVFAASPHSVLGPIQIENQYFIIKVEEFIAPQLNAENRQTISTRLFKEWLETEVNYVLYQ
jgi:parvulin-like peptidyl-prolyl isomerase